MPLFQYFCPTSPCGVPGPSDVFSYLCICDSRQRTLSLSKFDYFLSQKYVEEMAGPRTGDPCPKLHTGQIEVSNHVEQFVPDILVSKAKGRSLLVNRRGSRAVFVYQKTVFFSNTLSKPKLDELSHSA